MLEYNHDTQDLFAQYQSILKRQDLINKYQTQLNKDKLELRQKIHATFHEKISIFRSISLSIIMKTCGNDITSTKAEKILDGCSHEALTAKYLEAESTLEDITAKCSYKDTGVLYQNNYWWLIYPPVNGEYICGLTDEGIILPSDGFLSYNVLELSAQEFAKMFRLRVKFITEVIL